LNCIPFLPIASDVAVVTGEECIIYFCLFMNRKEFLQRLGLAVGALTVAPLSVSAGEATADTPKLTGNSPKLSRKQMKALEALTEARHKARWRTRRIINNNDGNDVILASGEVVSREMFLAKRFLGLTGTQVDTVCYCTGITFGGHHRGKNQLWQKRYGMTRCSEELDAMGTDSLELAVEFCHQHNIEIFWSHRMNDRHDTGPVPELVTEFKKEHPEYLIGFGSAPLSFNYALEPVREKLLECCREVVENYDVDGIELDWFRHLQLFPSVIKGGVASDEEREMINDMMRKLRAIMDEEGLRRGRPLLLAVRVPDSREYARQTGIDYEQWLKEDLVDVLFVNDYIKLEPWKDFPPFARKYNVPAYASMEKRRLSLMDMDAKGKVVGGSFEDRARSEAYAAWLSGMNGIHAYNFYFSDKELYNQLGDPYVLAEMNVKPRESFGTTKSIKGMAYCSVEYWLKGGRKFLKKPDRIDYVMPSGDRGYWPNSPTMRDDKP